MEFKERLREKRLNANLTQAQLAEMASVTPRTIQNYEHGSRKPTQYAIVYRIALALNTSPEYLLGEGNQLLLSAQKFLKSDHTLDLGTLVDLLVISFSDREMSVQELERAVNRINEAYQHTLAGRLKT